MKININSQNYTIIKELGKGGYGKVYQVLNKKEKKYYALKKISLEDISEEEMANIENEAKILSRINNDHIVKYYYSYKDNNSFNILMEYCEGLDLKNFINKHKKKKESIKEQVIFNFVLDICYGLKQIHKMNLIHRDLKPENIFIYNNNIKIGDFGISKQLDMNNKYAKTVIGTYNYMAPEMIKGEKYNEKIDIWALGCIIYELLSICLL